MSHVIRLLGTAITLPAGTAGAQSATCVRAPTSASNGLVRIDHPGGGDGASVQRACDVGARQLAADVTAAGKASGVPVRWVDVYSAEDRCSTT